MLKKIVQILLLVLFFLLPLINSHLFDFIGIQLPYFYVHGNYEFSKIIFFNIFSGIIFFLFLYDNIIKNKKIKIPTIVPLIILILLISNIFSISPFISFFGDSSKGHSTILFINLIGILIVLLNQKEYFFKKIFNTLVISAIFISIVGIWQYFYPSFDYGDLGNRAISTLGHPNYLSLYLLFIIPYLYNKITVNKLYIIILVLVITTLILTKSAWGIILFIFYSLYLLIKKNKIFKSKNTILLTGFILVVFLILFILKYYPEKLHSFISRFFIWKSTLELSFSGVKYFFIGYGLETLSLTFEKTKSIYLYIFENIGFTADRPHNLILNIFYHLGFLGVSIFSYLIYKLIKIIYTEKNIPNYCKNGIIIFLVFTIFNFSSIVSYLILIIFIVRLILKIDFNYIKNKYINKITLIIISLISLIGINSSYSFYKSETYNYQDKYIKAINIFKYNPDNYYELGDFNTGLKYSKYKGEIYFYSKLTTQNTKIKNNCEELLNNFPSPENYFYCGDIIEYLGNESIGINYYKKGLNLLPDLWKKDSKYNQNIFIKNFVDGKRFFSEKYSDLTKILEKVNKYGD